MAAERHLLFAVLAFESEFIDLVQLTSACRAWAEDKSQPLADLLVVRGWLSNEDRVFVEKLVERKLAKHQDDPRVTLNAITRGDVCDAIKEVDDADIQQSLSSWPSAGPVLIETIGETLIQTDQPKSRYTWMSEVGKGGLGKVWLARDNELAREVALKEIKPGSSAASQEAVRRLIKEAQITGQLQHPNIVPVYEVNRGSRPFYTMKLVKGETLTKAIRKHHDQRRGASTVAGRTVAGLPTVPLDPLSLPRLLNVFVKVCDALAYAHSRGVIHRDLKPENIILGEYGEAIVLDWGLAKQVGSSVEESAPVVLTEDAISEATRAGATPGTLPYMAPEQARGRVDQMDHQTDIYGLGAILFEILTGEAPHKLRASDTPVEGPSPVVSPLGRIAAYLTQIADCPTPLAREREPSVPAALNAICGKAMARAKADRYATTSAFAEDIEHWLADEPVSAHQEAPFTTALRWGRKHRAWAMSGAAALVIVAVVSTFLAFLINVQKGLVSEQERKATQLANRNAALAKEKSTLAEQESSARAKADLNADAALQQTKLAERRLYSSHMNIAQAAWDSAKVEKVLDLLDQHQPRPGEEDLRGFEWFYLDRLCHADLFTLKGHTKPVYCLAYSPNGERLVSGSRDQTIKLWDTATGQELLTLKGHIGEVMTVAFSPDGHRLASSDHQGTIKLWNAVTGLEVFTSKENAGWVVGRVAFSPDGGLFVVSGEQQRQIKLLDVATGDVISTMEDAKDVNGMAFSPDGKRLAVSASDSVQLWDTIDGQFSRSLKIERVFQADEFTITFGSHQGHPVDFSPDGRTVAFATHWGKLLWLDAKSGKKLPLQDDNIEYVTSVAFNPGGYLAVGSRDQTIRVWDTQAYLSRVDDSQQGSLVSPPKARIMKGHTGEVLSLAVNPNGKELASASADGTIKIWNSAVGQSSTGLRYWGVGFVQSVAFSPSGKRLASANLDGTVNVWDTAAGTNLMTLKGHTGSASSVVFSPDGKSLASTSNEEYADKPGELKIWDAANGQETLSLKGHKHGIYSVAFSPDGKRLATASGGYEKQGGEVKVWDVASGQETLSLKGHDSRVSGVVFSADGKLLASASYDQTLKVWDAASGQELLSLKGHTKGTSSVAFSPDGKRLASASHDQTLKVWDTISGNELLTLRGHTYGVTCVVFSPDGKRLASASGEESGGAGEVKVWDAATGHELLDLKGHLRRVNGVAFSADGQWLASASDDETVKLWDARPSAKAAEHRAVRESSIVFARHRDRAATLEELREAILKDKTVSNAARSKAVELAVSVVPIIPDSVAPSCPVATDFTSLSSLGRSELLYMRSNNSVAVKRFDNQAPSSFAATWLAPARLIARPNARLAFALCKNRLFELIPQSKDSSKELLEFPRIAFDVALHPTQDRMAWCRTESNGGLSVIISKFDGTDETNLGFGYDPAWSADGQKLIFTCHNAEEDWHIVVRDDSQTHRIRVPAHPAVGLYPNPSPDGKQIAFAMKGEDETMQIGLVSMDGQQIRQLTRTGDQNSFAAFSPDGNHIAFLRKKPPNAVPGASPCVVIVNVKTGEETVVANDAQDSRPVWRMSTAR